MSGEDPSCGSADDGGDHDFSKTLPLLEQLCWHLFCCGLIFDVFQDDLYPAISPAACAGDLPDHIEELRQDLQVAFRVAAQRVHGEPARSEAENAVEEIEDAAAAELLPFLNRETPPECALPGCEDLVLYLEAGRWSARCYAHSSAPYRVRHHRVQDWFCEATERAFTLRMMARRNVATALVTWWDDVGSLRHLVEDAIRTERLVLPPDVLP